MKEIARNGKGVHIMPKERTENGKPSAGNVNFDDDALGIIKAVDVNKKSEPVKEVKEPLSPGETVMPEDSGSRRGRKYETAEIKEPEKKKAKIFRPLVFIIILLFCVFAAADIISQQNEIEQLRQETEMLGTKIEQSKQENDEYEAMLGADEDEFIERVAVEELGYSYPNERRYYIVVKP